MDILKSIVPIPGYPDYGAARDGRIYRLTFRNKQCFRPYDPPRPIATKNHHGYLKVTIRKDNSYCDVFVHRLILLAFVGPCPEGMEAAHFPDRDRTNNRIENLSYATKKVNHSHKNIHGTMIRGEQSHRAKLTESQVREIKNQLSSGMAQQGIADRYGVSRTAVEQIKLGRNWRNV